MGEERCGTCRFWLRHAAKGPGVPDTGECRRGPPVLNPEAVRLRLPAYAGLEEYAANEAAHWNPTCWAHPACHDEDWCGEWRAADAPTQAKGGGK